MPDIERSLERLEVDLDGVVELTRALVRVPSVYRPEDGLDERPAAELVASTMRGFGWDPVIEDAAEGRPNVFAVVEGGLDGPTLMFEGHTDVVTEGDLSAWTHAPYGAVLKDGRVYGRGSADMKGGVAAMLCAVDAVARAGPFPGRILVAALADEEGMMLGAKAFVARGHGEDVDAAIVCEPEGGEICVVQKGAIRIRIDATGRMAHGAMPQHGANPILALAQAITQIQGLESELQSSCGEYRHLGLPYVTPTVVGAGDLIQLNVIPAEGVIALDVRTTPAVDHEDLVHSVRRIASVVSASSGVELAVNVIDDRPATEVAIDHPVVASLAAAHESVTSQAPVYGGVPGSTDGTILWRDARIPVVVYGPGGKWIAHQADEYVEVEDLQRAAQVYARAALIYLNGSSTR